LQCDQGMKGSQSFAFMHIFMTNIKHKSDDLLVQAN